MKLSLTCLIKLLAQRSAFKSQEHRAFVTTHRILSLFFLIYKKGLYHVALQFDDLLMCKWKMLDGVHGRTRLNCLNRLNWTVNLSKFTGVFLFTFILLKYVIISVLQEESLLERSHISVMQIKATLRNRQLKFFTRTN